MKLHLENIPRTLGFLVENDKAYFTYLDQRVLPYRVETEKTAAYKVAVDAIKTLAVRGAPAIGIAGAAAVALWLKNDARFTGEEAFRASLDEVAGSIAQARPTAVNLSWAVELMVHLVFDALDQGKSFAQIQDEACAKVGALIVEDEKTNRLIGKAGAELIPEGATVLTHCNAGSLATAFYGTALGVIYAAAEQGKIKHVYADETRPVGQGARLTVWELARAGINVTLNCDNMAATLMEQGKIDCVIVGADRIAANGDTANKIGTYALAVLALYHRIPFYVAAPFSSFDLSIETGADIRIEQRAASEVLPQPIAGVDVYNPAFDVTPGGLVSAFITEKGIFRAGNIPSMR